MPECQEYDDPLLPATTPGPVVRDVVEKVAASGSFLKALSFRILDSEASS